VRIDMDFQTARPIEPLEASRTNVPLATVRSRKFVIITIRDVARIVFP
jgi:hypothetical protein